MTEEGRSRIEKFNGTNFALWYMQIEDYLFQKDLDQPLLGVEKKPKDMNDDQWSRLDRKALGTIRLSLAPSVAFNITTEKTTSGLIKALKAMYEKPSASNKVFLMKKMFNLRMKEGGSVAEHLNEFNTLTSQLNSDNWDYISIRWGSGFLLATFVRSIVSPFSSNEKAAEVEEFFASRMKPSIVRTLKQSVEHVKINANWVQSIQNEKSLGKVVRDLAYRKH